MGLSPKTIFDALGRTLLCLALFLSVSFSGFQCPAQGLNAAFADEVTEDSQEGDDPSADPEPDDPEPADENLPTKIKLETFPVKSDGANTWDVSAGTSNSISVNGGKLRICVSTIFKDGTRIREYQTESWGQVEGVSDGFDYVWSGNAISVNSQGVVTALKDGESTITVSPKNAKISSLSASITVKTMNQGGGFLVKSITIVDKDGKAYGSDTIYLDDVTTNVKLYAKVK